MAEPSDGADGAETKVEFVPVEQFKAVEQQLAGTQGQLAQLQQTMQGLHAMMLESRRPAPPAPAAVEDVAEAELDEAVTTGSGAGGKIKKTVEARIERLVRERIEPLQRLGLETMGGFAAEMAKTARDEKGALTMPHYTRFKDEIDTIIAGLNPAMRMNPRAYIEAHNSVVGRHATELIEEAKTGAARDAEPGRGDPPAPNGRTGRTVAAGAIPKFEEHFSREVVNALGGASADEFCKSLGYKNWADYYQKAVVGA